MTFSVDFTSFDGEKYSVSRKVENFDRNYDDEEYALIFVDNPKSEDGGYFELNILKVLNPQTNEWELSDRGYLAEYSCIDDTMPFSCTQLEYTITN